MFQIHETFDLDQELDLNLEALVTSTPIPNPQEENKNNDNNKTKLVQEGTNLPKVTNNISKINFKKFFFKSTKDSVPDKPVKRLSDENTSNSSKKICLKDQKSNEILKLMEQSSEKNSNELILKNKENNDINSKKIESKFSNENIKIFISAPKKENVTKLVQERKFPGPAGLLLPSQIAEINKENTSNTVTICSQNTVKIFNDQPWNQMMRDFENASINLVEKYSIAWLKNCAQYKTLIKQKSPFLAAIIESIDLTKDGKCSIKLKDPTGTINGVLDKESKEKYGNHLLANSVVVLKQTAVLTTTFHSLINHYISITENNIIAIYKNDGEIIRTEQFLTPDKIIKQIKSVKNQQFENHKTDEDGFIQAIMNKYKNQNNQFNSCSNNFKTPVTDNNHSSKTNNQIPISASYSPKINEKIPNSTNYSPRINEKNSNSTNYSQKTNNIPISTNYSPKSNKTLEINQNVKSNNSYNLIQNNQFKQDYNKLNQNNEPKMENFEKFMPACIQKNVYDENSKNMSSPNKNVCDSTKKSNFKFKSKNSSTNNIYQSTDMDIESILDSTLEGLDSNFFDDF